MTGVSIKGHSVPLPGGARGTLRPGPNPLGSRRNELAGGRTAPAEAGAPFLQDTAMVGLPGRTHPNPARIIWIGKPGR